MNISASNTHHYRNDKMPNPFRNLPSVNQLLESEPLKKMVESVNHSVVANGVRDFLDDLRTQVSQATEDVSIPSPGEIAESIASWLEKEQRPALRNQNLPPWR